MHSSVYHDAAFQISYMISAWARMCKIMGKEFEQYLPLVMGPVMKAASLKPEVALVDSKWKLTHWGRDNMAAISQTIISNAFSWMKMFEFRLRFHWILFLRVQLTIFPTLFQIMAWRRPGDKPLSEPMMVRLPTHICVTRPQWVNSW